MNIRSLRFKNSIKYKKNDKLIEKINMNEGSEVIHASGVIWVLYITI